MFNILADVSCGNVITIDSMVPNFVSTLVTIIKIVIPIILIVLGLLDLGKATIAQKDDEIKKAQTTFVKRIIAAVLVFFVVAIVQLVFGLLHGAQSDDPDATNPMACVDCFINGNCDATVVTPPATP